MPAPLLFVNPTSGDHEDSQHLIDAATERGVEVRELGDDLEADLDAAFDPAAPLAGIAGGDGSLSLLARRCIDHDVGFVCIPFGTRNHFARDVGLDRNDPIAALDAYISGVERRVDVAELNGSRLFLNNATFGVYAEVVDDEEYRDAKVRTGIRVTRELLRGDREPDPISLRSPDGTHHETPFAVLIGNNCYSTASVRGLGQRDRLDEGVLQVWVFEAEGAMDLFSIAGATLGSGPEDHPNVELWVTPELELLSPNAEVKAGFDGEACSVAFPLRIRILPRALRLHLPAAPG